jgi:hypothetical protein
MAERRVSRVMRKRRGAALPAAVQGDFGRHASVSIRKCVRLCSPFCRRREATAFEKLIMNPNFKRGALAWLAACNGLWRAKKRFLTVYDGLYCFITGFNGLRRKKLFLGATERWRKWKVEDAALCRGAATPDLPVRICSDWPGLRLGAETAQRAVSTGRGKEKVGGNPLIMIINTLFLTCYIYKTQNMAKLLPIIECLTFWDGQILIQLIGSRIYVCLMDAFVTLVQAFAIVLTVPGPIATFLQLVFDGKALFWKTGGLIVSLMTRIDNYGQI